MSRSSFVHFLTYNRYAQDYLEKTHKKTISLKFPIHFEVHTLDEATQQKVKDHTRILDNKIPLPVVWNIVPTAHIEFNMPFTLDNVIVFPRDDIIRKTSPEILYTLCHEQIHVLQRAYPRFYESLSQHVLGFKRVKIQNWDTLPWVSSGWCHYSNPDGLQHKQSCWIVFDMLYILSIDMENPEFPVKSMFELKQIPGSTDTYRATRHIVGEKDKERISYENKLQRDYEFCAEHHRYHPYEIIADTQAKYYLHGTSGDTTLDTHYSGFQDVRSRSTCL